MESVLTVAALWLLFAATHIGLATRRIRAVLVARLGERGFMGLFSLVAAAAFTLVVAYYAAHRFDGPPGLAFGAGAPVLRWALMGTVVAGIVLMAGSLTVYPRSPMALFNETVRTPYGLERITRHGFFVGVALLAGAHVLLAPRLVGAVFAGGLLLVAVVGAWHQDRKLLRLRGEPYAAYLAATSAVPFAAILGGRQRLVPGELAWGPLVGGLVVAALLRWVHDSLFTGGGAWIVGAVIGGAALEILQSVRSARRRSSRLAHGTA
jgi:uncharacterized membrane protein